LDEEPVFTPLRYKIEAFDAKQFFTSAEEPLWNSYLQMPEEIFFEGKVVGGY
jgi:hypothetical protein